MGLEEQANPIPQELRIDEEAMLSKQWMRGIEYNWIEINLPGTFAN